jgi:hypothetical protein
MVDRGEQGQASRCPEQMARGQPVGLGRSVLGGNPHLNRRYQSLIERLVSISVQHLPGERDHVPVVLDIIR